MSISTDGPYKCNSLFICVFFYWTIHGISTHTTQFISPTSRTTLGLVVVVLPRLDTRPYQRPIELILLVLSQNVSDIREHLGHSFARLARYPIRSAQYGVALDLEVSDVAVRDLFAVQRCQVDLVPAQEDARGARVHDDVEDVL